HVSDGDAVVSKTAIRLIRHPAGLCFAGSNRSLLLRHGGFADGGGERAIFLRTASQECCRDRQSTRSAKKSGGSLRRFLMGFPKFGFLAAQTDAYFCEGTVENDIFPCPVIDAAIQRAEEEVCSIAKADLCVGALHRQSGKPADIGCDDGPGTTEGAGRDIVLGGRRRQREGAAVEISARTAVAAMGFGSAEQQGGIGTPIEIELRTIRLPGDERRCIPRNGGANAAEIALGFKCRSIGMMMRARIVEKGLCRIVRIGEGFETDIRFGLE